MYKYLRYYPPEKQGLRHGKNAIHKFLFLFSDTILQKNKDQDDRFTSEETTTIASDTILQKNKD